MINIDPIKIVSVLLSCTITFAFYIWIWNKKFANKLVNIITKAFAMIIILFTLFVLSVFVKPMAAFLILAMVYTIFSYTKLFAKRSGLVKGNIVEATSLAEFLLKNKETILMGKEFLNQQANIFALDLEEDFAKNDAIKNYYRLDIISALVRRL